MNKVSGDDTKRTVGFALLVLQRRLASSPEAILRSLARRRDRLQGEAARVRDADDRLAGALAASLGLQLPDVDELSPADAETYEDDTASVATAARTLEELETEIADPRTARGQGRGGAGRPRGRQVGGARRAADQRRRCTTSRGDRRKIIIFTEHRDTLEYLEQRLFELLPPLHRHRGHPRRDQPAGSAAGPDPVHAGAEQLDPARHGRGRRGREPPGRPPDGQLRHPVEPEPARAALRPDPPHRSAARLSPVEPRRGRHPRRRRVPDPPRQARGAARGVGRPGLRRPRPGADRREPRPAALPGTGGGRRRRDRVRARQGLRRPRVRRSRAGRLRQHADARRARRAQARDGAGPRRELPARRDPGLHPHRPVAVPRRHRARAATCGRSGTCPNACATRPARESCRATTWSPSSPSTVDSVTFVAARAARRPATRSWRPSSTPSMRSTATRSPEACCSRTTGRATTTRSSPSRSRRPTINQPASLVTVRLRPGQEPEVVDPALYTSLAANDAAGTSGR